MSDPVQENIEEILEHNNKVVSRIEKIHSKIEALNKELIELEGSLKPPCFHCLYDGVYRCEACQENFYRDNSFSKDNQHDN